MNLHSHSLDLESMTDSDKSNANLIVFLMVTARTMQYLNALKAAGRPADDARSPLYDLLNFLIEHHPSGKRMETEVLALALKLGFDIQPIPLSKVAHA